MNASWVTTLAGVLVLSVLVGSLVLGAGWLAAALVGRRRPALRHQVLQAALLVYLGGPLWVLAARQLPPGVLGGAAAARVLALLDALDAAGAPDRGDAAGTRAHGLAGADGGSTAIAGAGSTAFAAARRGGVGAWLRGADAWWAVGVWGLGALGLLGRLGWGWRQVRRLRRSAQPITGQLGGWVRATLRAQFPGRPLPPVLVSHQVDSPLVLGLRRPAILLPPAALALDRAQLAQVLAHEMGHVLRGDLRTGLLQRLAAALHWPNPVVHLCRRALLRAQEESCDDLALAASGRPADYARTLLALATAPPTAMGPVLAMAAAGTSLERRIRRVLEGSAPSAPTTTLPGLLRAMTGPRAAAATQATLTLGVATAIALAATTTPATPTSANAVQTRRFTGSSRAAEPREPLEPSETLPSAAPLLPVKNSGLPAAPATDATSLFRDAGDSVEGAFVLVDVGTGATQTVNADLAGARFSPMSTYKVVIAAAALEVGVLRDEHTVIKWDGRVHDLPAGNRDLDLREAMKLSSNWYFQEVFRRLGEGRVRAFAEKLGFGAATGTPRPGTTWMDGGLTITPVEQAQFFARFAAGQLPVSARSQDVLRRILVIDERGPITLRGKTGTGWLDGGVTIAWLAGTVEQPTRRYAFAAFFRGAEADRARLAERRHAITRRLLARFGALPREMAP